MNDYEVKCIDCGWKGYEVELEIGSVCPECGSDRIEDIEFEEEEEEEEEEESESMDAEEVL